MVQFVESQNRCYLMSTADIIVVVCEFCFVLRGHQVSVWASRHKHYRVVNRVSVSNGLFHLHPTRQFSILFCHIIEYSRLHPMPQSIHKQLGRWLSTCCS